MDDIKFNNADVAPAGPVEVDAELSLAALGMLLMAKDAESLPDAPSTAVSVALEEESVLELPNDLGDDGLLLG